MGTEDCSSTEDEEEEEEEELVLQPNRDSSTEVNNEVTAFHQIHGGRTVEDCLDDPIVNVDDFRVLV